MKNSLPALIKKYADSQPERAALISSSDTITYFQLNELVSRYALHLKEIGINREMTVAVLSKNSIEYVIAVLSLWQIGAIPVLINYRLTEGEIITQLDDSNSAFLITTNQYIKQFKKYSKILLEIPGTVSAEDENKIDVILFDEYETAVIIYTSGTTGLSKGVMLTHRNLNEAAKASVQLLQQTGKDRWLASLPFYHIGGFAVIYRALFTGASLIISSSQNNESLIEMIYKFNPTLLSLVSTQLKRFVDQEVKPNNELRYVLSGGSPIDDYIIIKAIKLGWNILKVYGSTETAAFVTVVDCKKDKNRFSSSGKPLHNCIIKIVDENGNELPANKEGEIIISSPAIMKGYWNKPEETSEKLKNGFYYSGDYGFIDDDGYLYIQSRRTDLIISGGENINPIEIEKYLSFHPAVNEVCVIGIKDEEWGEVPAAIISVNKNMSITLEEVHYYLKEKISSLKFPKKIFIFDELPKTSLGKIKRDELKQKFY